MKKLRSKGSDLLGNQHHEHTALMEAAIAHRADEAVALLRAHFERTAKIIMDDPVLAVDQAGRALP